MCSESEHEKIDSNRRVSSHARQQTLVESPSMHCADAGCTAAAAAAVCATACAVKSAVSCRVLAPPEPSTNAHQRRETNKDDFHSVINDVVTLGF